MCSTDVKIKKINRPYICSLIPMLCLRSNIAIALVVPHRHISRHSKEISIVHYGCL